MLNWTKRLNEITNSSLPDEMKNQRLSVLIADLEMTYEIPVLKNSQFEQNNPFVMQLYDTTSAEISN